MSKFSWLHISDVHIKKPGEQDSHRQKQTLQAFLDYVQNDLPKALKDKQMKLPSFVCITGDLGFAGEAADYDCKKSSHSGVCCVRGFLNELGKRLKFDKNDIPSKMFAVAGNHDVYRATLNKHHEKGTLSMAKETEEIESNLIGAREEQKEVRRTILNRLKNYAQFYREFKGMATTTDIEKVLWYTASAQVETDPPVKILGLCSAWLCQSDWAVNQKGNSSEKDEERCDHLRFGERITQNLLSKVDKDVLVIALIHHNVERICDDERQTAQKRLYPRCQFLLSGHAHKDEIWSKALKGITHRIQAGSLYENPEHRNEFNVIEVDTLKNVGRLLTCEWHVDRESWQVDVHNDPTGGLKTPGYDFKNGVLEFGLKVPSGAPHDPSSEPSVVSPKTSSEGAIERKEGIWLGVDVGRANIDSCIVRYTKNAEGNKPYHVYLNERVQVKPVKGNQLEGVYACFKKILPQLFKIAKENGLSPIEGLGIGLPGKVTPPHKMVKAPGLTKRKNVDFVKELKKRLKREVPRVNDPDFKILLDNDVRCGTRYPYLCEDFKDGICIFIGNGFGSGVVSGGRLLYGTDFAAGEIGHTMIGGFANMDKLKDFECNCGEDSLTHCHLEAFCSNYGMVKIAQLLDCDSYETLLKIDKVIVSGTGNVPKEFEELLEQPVYKSNISRFMENGELTTYFLSLAYHAENEYAVKIVQQFTECLAVGISNYINIVDPSQIRLWGGIIDGFFTDSAIGNSRQNLEDYIEKFSFMKNQNGVITYGSDPNYDTTRIFNTNQSSEDDNSFSTAAAGAALLFQDMAYLDRI